MMLAGSRRPFAFSIALGTAFAVANACASDPEITPRQPGGAGGLNGGGGQDSSTVGGSTGVGGAVGSNGASGASGSSGTTGSGSGGATGTGGGDGGCVPHMGPPILDPTTLPKCTLADNASCTDARCLPTNLVPEGSRASLAPCADPAQLCVPDFFIAAGGNFIPPTCKSLLDAEGRCLSMCIPQISSQIDLLPQSTCAATERCAPCYDPRTGMDTGACKQSCDKGPTEGAKTFPECCNALGRCVPNTLVPESQRSQLGKDSCSGADDLCAPKAQVTDPTSKPKSCTTFPPQNREGRCLPACLPAVSGRASQLRQETCEMGELCAPCYDPVNGGSTGACGINGDMPAQPDPGAFVRCDAVATIIILPVPIGEGRCVPPYLAGSQASILQQTTCKAGEICAPCVNPLGDGGPQPTGACPAGDGGAPRDAGPG